jgi:hypothetical protein
MAKETKKQQGKSVSGASLSAKNQMKFPEMLERGLGSSYAMAVSRLMDQASSLSGSKNGFLGVEKVTLDPVEHGSHSLIEKKEK